MSDNIKVVLNGKSLEVTSGSTIAELLARATHPGPYPALAAIAGSRIVGIYRKIRSEMDLTTIDRTTKEGMDIYRRTASILLYAACEKIYPGALVEIGQSIMGGYFFTVHGHKVTKPGASKVEKHLRRIVEEDHPLRPRWVDTEAAIRIVRKDKLNGKADLLEQDFHEETAMVDLNGSSYHLNGPVAMSTGSMDCLAITAYKGGMVLHFPAYSDDKPEIGEPQEKLFATFRETQKWNQLVDCEDIAQLNEHCKAGSISRLIKISEALHERKIISIADEIISRQPDSRLVLISGPSSSGKTTFSKRLEVQLQVSGLKPVTLSMDNYYVNREKTPLNPDGSWDFEAVEALDVKLLNKHVKDLIAGKEVRTPVFDFKTGKRLSCTAPPLQLGPRSVLIMEGIHALNERLTSKIAAKNKFKIFVSALTQLNIDEHNRIFTSDSRLLRRLVRDRLYRGYSAEHTIKGWASVRAGEVKHIFPFQENADVMFNSALVYEQAVLKNYAIRFLMEVPRSSPAFIEASRLVQFLSLFIPIFEGELPPTSVLREFIGGSTFHY